ncbi:hypothetical protein EYF80_028059 [Liparis tanakae]|uniref:Uncharacterized protein n=1 Tax=Liparis tanakae TaxID=230148 RepID=A0A4Z2H702_9TELE|nr:hypothetical protein EYF80_028059 [Liparis tanakae]
MELRVGLVPPSLDGEYHACIGDVWGFAAAAACRDIKEHTHMYVHVTIDVPHIAERSDEATTKHARVARLGARYDGWEPTRPQRVSLPGCSPSFRLAGG